MDGELTEWFTITMGFRQGCGLSPVLFNPCLEAMIFALKATKADAEQSTFR